MFDLIYKLLKLADSYDVVVNCTGFGARELCGDSLVEPVRGQVIRVSKKYDFKNLFLVFYPPR